MQFRLNKKKRKTDIKNLSKLKFIKSHQNSNLQNEKFQRNSSKLTENTSSKFVKID